MTSGLATLRILQRDDPYPALEARSAKLAAGLQAAVQTAGVAACVQRVGSMMTLFFHPGPIRDYDEATASDTKRFARFFWELLARGVYWPCSQFEALFVSAAHDDAVVEATLAAAREAAAAA
jgi:glutamate-1-semialdehyde 2,1-aminomutase